MDTNSHDSAITDAPARTAQEDDNQDQIPARFKPLLQALRENPGQVEELSEIEVLLLSEDDLAELQTLLLCIQKAKKGDLSNMDNVATCYHPLLKKLRDDWENSISFQVDRTSLLEKLILSDANVPTIKEVVKLINLDTWEICKSFYNASLYGSGQDVIEYLASILPRTFVVDGMLHSKSWRRRKHRTKLAPHMPALRKVLALDCLHKVVLEGNVWYEDDFLGCLKLAFQNENLIELSVKFPRRLGYPNGSEGYLPRFAATPLPSLVTIPNALYIASLELDFRNIGKAHNNNPYLDLLDSIVVRLPYLNYLKLVVRKDLGDALPALKKLFLKGTLRKFKLEAGSYISKENFPDLTPLIETLATDDGMEIISLHVPKDAIQTCTMRFNEILRHGNVTLQRVALRGRSITAVHGGRGQLVEERDYYLARNRLGFARSRDLHTTLACLVDDIIAVGNDFGGSGGDSSLDDDSTIYKRVGDNKEWIISIRYDLLRQSPAKWAASPARSLGAVAFPSRDKKRKART